MARFRASRPPLVRGLFGVTAAVTALVLAAPVSAQAAPPYPSDNPPPPLVTLLTGYAGIWVASGKNDLHGTVKNAAVLERDDELTVWINNHATKAERFLALQDSEYNTDATGPDYDQSVTVGTGLGSLLGKAYIKGRTSGALPLTTALINSESGTAGAYVSTGVAKVFYGHPRPYLPSDSKAAPVAGDDSGCAASFANGSSLQVIRLSRSYADAKGNLLIRRVAPVVDKTHRFSPNSVALDAAYGLGGICLGGSFPSGHTTAAYQAGITLATLVPELGPEVLARASENGNNRIVLGVHYPLDIVGGRIDGEAALAERWSDAKFRTEVLEPARAELLAYLKKQTGHSLAWAVSHQDAYASNPYGGAKMPGGTAQVVTDRKSALKVYTERLTYGFPLSGTPGLPADVPAGASNLLLTTFPSLTDDQRTSVLEQTEIASGYPLDQTGSADGSWQRLNLAAAMSATVQVKAGGVVRVVSTGGKATVLGSAEVAMPSFRMPMS